VIFLSKTIVIVTPWYGEFAGGAEVAARGIAEELVRYGINVEVLTTKCKSPYYDWWEDSINSDNELINGVIVKRFNVNKVGKEKYENAIVKQVGRQVLTDEDKNNFFKYGINSDDLIKYVKNLNDQYEIIAIPYFNALMYSLVTTIPNRINIIPCFHNEEQFYWDQVKNMIANCKSISYLSYPEKSMTIKQYGNQVGKKVVEGIVTGIGVEIKDIKDTKLEGFKLPNKYFVYVGRKEIGKGVGKLIEWYKNSSINIPLVFIGGGDKQLIPNDSKFIDLGFVDEAVKSKVISSSIALINLSQNESFSLVIMEAWLLKVPVIVSKRCEVTKYHCQKSGGGYWVSNNNEFETILNQLVNNSVKGKDMGMKGQEYVKQNYSWNTVLYNLINNIGDVYEYIG
jgi:glycosyltransferase involved in cell wall biosynthesis